VSAPRPETCPGCGAAVYDRAAAAATCGADRPPVTDLRGVLPGLTPTAALFRLPDPRCPYRASG
jgi:hypothetical protein